MRFIYKIGIALCAFAVILGVISCLQVDEDSKSIITTSVSFSFKVSPTPQTKSAFTAEHDSSTIKDLNLWVYDSDGSLREGGYFTRTDSLKISGLAIGGKYYVRVLANVGEKPVPQTLLECDALTLGWDIASFNQEGAMPMSYADSFTALALGTAMDVHLVRLFAKYTFGVDASSFFHGTFTVRSLRLRNAPSCCRIFSANAASGDDGVMDGDYATADDLAAINDGFSKTFYLYENLQGDILSGNSDSWKKEFVNYNQSKSDCADKCSYLEVVGDYAGGDGLLASGVTFRAYLGENATTNFDVTRNTEYTVTLVLDEYNSLYKNGLWKLTPGTITDNRSISVPSSITVSSLGSATLPITVSPSNLQVCLSTDSDFAAARLSKTLNGNSSVSLRNTEALAADRSTRLTFTTWDSRKSTSCVVTVKAAVTLSGTSTEWDYQSAGSREYDGGYWAKIGGSSSSSVSVGASAGSVEVSATAGHTHYVQPQEQARSRTKYSWSDGSVSYGAWSGWSSAYDYGSATTSSVSDTPSLTSSASWLSASGSYGENTSASARSAMVTASNGGSTATLTVNQAAGKTITGTSSESQTQSAGSREYDDGYWALVGGQSSSSVSVGYEAGSVEVSATAGHTHHIQPQSQTRSRDVYSWSDGSVTYGEWGSWSVYDDGTVASSSVSDTPTLKSSSSWLSVSGTYTANSSTSSSRSATITATNGSASAKLTVTQAKKPSITATTVEYEYQSASSVESDGNYWVLIGGSSSSSASVGAAAGSVTVAATAGHTHTVQPRSQKRSRNKYTWSDGSVTYGDWGSWSSAYNDGSATSSSVSDTPSLKSSASWLSTGGVYSANTSTSSSRNATITATNGSAKATLKVTQSPKGTLTAKWNGTWNGYMSNTYQQGGSYTVTYKV